MTLKGMWNISTPRLVVMVVLCLVTAPIWAPLYILYLVSPRCRAILVKILKT